MFHKNIASNQEKVPIWRRVSILFQKFIAGFTYRGV